MLCHNFHFMFSFYAMSRDNVRIRPWCGNAFTFASCSSVFASFWVLPSTSYSVLNLTYSVLNLTYSVLNLTYSVLNLTWPKLDANVSSSHQYLNVFVTWNTVSSIIIRDVTRLQQGLVSRWVTSLPRLCVTAEALRHCRHEFSRSFVRFDSAILSKLARKKLNSNLNAVPITRTDNVNCVIGNVHG